MALPQRFAGCQCHKAVASRPRLVYGQSSRLLLGNRRYAYNVDVETDRPPAPDSAPRWGSSPPPPPPPPPPPAKKPELFAAGDIRRDVLIALLGAGIGVAGMYVYYEVAVGGEVESELNQLVESAYEQGAYSVIEELLAEQGDATAPDVGIDQTQQTAPAALPEPRK